MRDQQLLTARRRIWPIDWAYFGRVIVYTLLLSDDVRIRWLMAIASLGWALELFLNGTEVFARPFYAVMRVLPYEWWALAFLVHGVGAIWRIFERRERIGWALFINGLGVAVWLASTVSQNLASGHFLASTALEFTACVFLFITFVSTGWGSKSTTA